jgi:hypothetical protein
MGLLLCGVVHYTAAGKAANTNAGFMNTMLLLCLDFQCMPFGMSDLTRLAPPTRRALESKHSIATLERVTVLVELT